MREVAEDRRADACRAAVEIDARFAQLVLVCGVHRPVRRLERPAGIVQELILRGQRQSGRDIIIHSHSGRFAAEVETAHAPFLAQLVAIPNLEAAAQPLPELLRHRRHAGLEQIRPAGHMPYVEGD